MTEVSELFAAAWIEVLLLRRGKGGLQNRAAVSAAGAGVKIMDMQARCC